MFPIEPNSAPGWLDLLVSWVWCRPGVDSRLYSQPCHWILAWLWASLLSLCPSLLSRRTRALNCQVPNPLKWLVLSFLNTSASEVLIPHLDSMYSEVRFCALSHSVLKQHCEAGLKSTYLKGLLLGSSKLISTKCLEKFLACGKYLINVFFPLFFKFENRATESLNDLPKVAQLKNGRAWMQIQESSSRTLCS